MEKYLFKSERLGFRNWTEKDIPDMAKINADSKVMEFFPSLPNKEETEQFVDRMVHQFSENGFCYFAVDKLENIEFIGFIGIAAQIFESEFTPCVDIGWRLAQKEWGKGYASEGAKQCLEFAFNEVNLNEVISICTENNSRSEKVMKKIGMKKIGEFVHPKLKDHSKYRNCICYHIDKKMWQQSF